MSPPSSSPTTGCSDSSADIRPRDDAASNGSDAAIREKASLLFRLTALSAAVFVVTIFGFLVAAQTGDPSPEGETPDQAFAIALVVEAVLTICLGIVAMIADQRQNARRPSAPTQTASTAAPSESGPTAPTG